MSIYSNYFHQAFAKCFKVRESVTKEVIINILDFYSADLIVSLVSGCESDCKVQSSKRNSAEKGLNFDFSVFSDLLSSLRQLQSEIKVSRYLHHPHIVKFREAFEDDANVYIVMELCPNGVGFLHLGHRDARANLFLPLSRWQS